MVIRYISAVKDCSGYASAARNNIVAMARAGIDLTVYPVSFERQYTTHGVIGDIVNSYINVRNRWDVNLIHLTPENWPRVIENSITNIIFTLFNYTWPVFWS